jgi:hypothetical protein
LLLAAEKYGVESLKQDCSFILTNKSIAVDNLVQTLIFVDRLSLPRSMKTALIYLSNHGKEICARPEWKQLFKSHHEPSFRATQVILGLDSVDGRGITDSVTPKVNIDCPMPRCFGTMPPNILMPIYSYKYHNFVL